MSFTETDVHGKTVFVCDTCGKPVGRNSRAVHAHAHVSAVARVREREVDALHAIIEGLELDARSSSTTGEAALLALIRRAKRRADEIIADSNYDLRVEQARVER